MLYRKNVLRFGVPAAVLALVLTACGGDDDGSKESNGKSTSEAPTADSQEHSNEGKPAGQKPGAGGVLGTGKSATGKVEEGATPVTYEVVAQKVDVGTGADTRKLVRDPEKAKGLVPAVAHLKFTHKGGGVVKETPDAAVVGGPGVAGRPSTPHDPSTARQPLGAIFEGPPPQG
ncbi:hypothetical protein [Streptomyces flavofungini]|uniref:hypothetical protein n=1 Tax=Streptomyces flavofungini TaxID=68200 RepID=UPI0025AFB375|nr:hypothetical protein [Streptomyces flavofungini]WJV46598.1 hypothetical protein QUY26_14315 [Streptomyces flavofungini]